MNCGNYIVTYNNKTEGEYLEKCNRRMKKSIN